MQRDMDVVRGILLDMESSLKEFKQDVLAYDSSAAAGRLLVNIDIVEYHLVLLYEAKMISGVALCGWRGSTGKAVAVVNDHIWKVLPHHMTWAGHEFLDSVRDEAIWEKTKQAAAGIGNFGLNTIGELAKGFVKTQVEKYTGVAL